jgi:hypothetical protein
MPVIPLRQKNHKFKAYMGYIVRLHFEKKKSKLEMQLVIWEHLWKTFLPNGKAL